MNKEQKDIDTWFKEVGWEYWSPLGILARLTEEVGEFARALNHEFGEKKRKETEGQQRVEDELGDILFTLACFANKHDIDLDEALRKSLEKVQQRDKSRFETTAEK